MTNTLSSGSDDALRLIPISKLSLEGCLEFLAQDELLEVTPENLRIRKQILNQDQRMKAKSKLKYFYKSILIIAAQKHLRAFLRCFFHD